MKSVISNIFEEKMDAIFDKVYDHGNLGKYAELEKYLATRQDWSVDEVAIFLNSFDSLYRVIARAVTQAAQSKNAGAADSSNSTYISLLRSLRYNMAGVTLQRLRQGKAAVFVTTAEKGPQIDFAEVLSQPNMRDLANFIPDLKGISFAPSHSKFTKISDLPRHTDYPLVALSKPSERAPKGILDLYAYRDYMEKTLAADPDIPSSVNTSADIFNTYLTEAAYRKAYFSLRAKVVREGDPDRVIDVSDCSKYMEKTYAEDILYAKLRFCEVARDRLKSPAGVYLFAFEKGKPAGDLPETLKGTIFDSGEVFRDTYAFVHGKEYGVTGRKAFSREETIMSDNYYLQNNSNTRSTYLAITRTGLKIICGEEDFDLAAKMNLSDKYSDNEIAAMQENLVNFKEGLAQRPVAIKKAPTTVNKPAPKTMEVIKKSNRTNPVVFIPKTIEYAPEREEGGYTPVQHRAVAHKGHDSTAFVADFRRAQRDNAFYELQVAVDSRLSVVEYSIGELRRKILPSLLQDKTLTDPMIEVYLDTISKNVYEMARASIKEEGVVVLGFDKSGPKGVLKTALDQAQIEFNKTFETSCEVDYKSIKGFSMGTSDEEVDSKTCPVGDMIIEKSGKVTLTPNRNNQKLGEDRVQ